MPTWIRVILVTVVTLVGSLLSGVFWTSALTNQDLAIVMSFLTGVPLGLIVAGIWILTE